MTGKNHQTERVVKHHLNAFVLDLGIDAILADYHTEAVFISQDDVYTGKDQIRNFFENFIARLPGNIRKHFKLHCKKISGELAYIVWSAADHVPLGTNTFIVRNSKILQQTFALYAH